MAEDQVHRHPLRNPSEIGAEADRLPRLAQEALREAREPPLRQRRGDPFDGRGRQPVRPVGQPVEEMRDLARRPRPCEAADEARVDR